MNLTRQQLSHPTQLYREVKSSLSKKLHLLHAPAPLFAKIEITRRCNLNCIVCFRHSLQVKPDMDPRDFLTILDKLPHVHTIALHGYGEPLVHKDFMKFCRIVRSHKKKILLVTNGTLLNNLTTVRLMRFEGVQMISFSVDSFHADGYRGNDYYGDLGEIIKNTIRFRWLYGTHAKIIIHSTFNIDNIQTMPHMVEFAAKTGVDTISLQDITSLYEFGDSTSEKSIRKNKGSNNPILDAEITAFELGVDAQFHLEDQNRCHWLWRSIYIDVEGNVYPCTDTLNYPFGNIYTDDFQEIWNGEAARTFRKYWFSDPVDECSKCISRKK